MGRSSRLILVASLVFALFALWQAYLEYSNYSSVRSTLPIQPFDPLIGYRIGTMETPSPSPTVIPRASATSRGVRAAYHRNTATATAEPSPSPFPTLRPTMTPGTTFVPTTVPSPSPQPNSDGGIRFTIEPLVANWNDTVTVSWEIPESASNPVIHFSNGMEVGTLLGWEGSWYDLPKTGSRTVALKELVGDVCQTPTLVWKVEAYQENGELVKETLTATISYADVPLALTNISISPNPAPAYGPVTLTWEGTGGTNLSWLGNSGIDDFGVDAAKHWRELRLEGAIGTTSWVLNRHALTNTYQYTYGAPGMPAICGTVELQMTCPYDYWIDEPEQRTDASCPTSPPVTIPAAYQTFERGVMVWDSDLKMIYILYNDGSSERRYDYWNGEPVTYAESPPPGLLLPQQGFGYLWTTADFIHEKLGWATAPEQSYITTRQQIKNEISGYLSGYEIRGPIYFTLPDGRVVRN